ncbi:PAS domain-containing sensor histidine kinase [Allomuricauda sp. F6463D]|uniref:PAS domain-containing sensor histidine kinase n=1 Tax=Allomuricauda sp. F6463D TaxID=2926409 RepID=UPI001FF3BB14|nr:PAS domain-containing sensor histidine kinase [Muricauda sp. F6463D]MCK0160669.1 PAS domain S-box protein [Muricauda sp. F6463D]
MKNLDQNGTRELFENTAKIARIGLYELDAISHEIYWSEITKEITEVSEEFVPKLDNIEFFFKEGQCRENAKKALHEALTKAKPFDLDMEMITANGNQRFVRNIGHPKFENGSCVTIFGILQDITERKKTRFELARKNQLLSFAEKISKIGHWKWNANTGEVIWSDSLYEIYGHPKKETVSYETYLNYIHKDDRLFVEKKIHKAIETEIYEDLIYRIQLNDQSIKTIKSTGVVKKTSEKALEILGTCQDISEQITREQELVKKNQQLTFAEELAKIGYWEWDVVNDHLSWSDNMYRIFNMEIGTPLGFENVVAALHPDDRDMFRAHAEEFIAEKKFRKFMHRVVYKDGTVRTVELYGEVITNNAGNVVKIVGTTQDITEQRMSEIKFRGLLNSAPDTMVIIDQEGSIQLINEQAEKMFGYKSAELINQHVSSLVPNRLWDTMEYYAIEFFKDPKHTGLPTNLDFFVHNKTGFQIPVQITLSPLETSERLLVSIAIRDITEQKQSAHRILETNKSLKESARLLKAQNKQLEEFNHITSHNLRSPVSNLNALLTIYKTEEDPNIKESLIEKIESVTNHLTWTLDTLVESLVIKNKTPLSLEETFFEGTLQRTKEMLAAEILKTKAIIKYDFTESPKVMYNKIYLESIFLNLISNSLKYKAEDRIPEILIKSKDIEGKTQLEFKDNGLGIDLKKNGHKLFGFSKVFHRNKDAKGVGLFLTKAQIDAMGGKIWAESEPGVGTSFFINLNQ